MRDSVSDDFQRTSLGPDWFSLNGPTIISGALGRIGNVSVPAAAIYIGDPGPDQFSQIVVGSDYVSSIGIDAVTRFGSTFGSAAPNYGCLFNPAQQEWEIKYDGLPDSRDIGVLVSSSAFAPPVPGDTIRNEVRGQTITCARNGVVLLTATVGPNTAGFGPLTGGSPGMAWKFDASGDRLVESWVGGPL